jgi:hypothetical protein
LSDACDADAADLPVIALTSTLATPLRIAAALDGFGTADALQNTHAALLWRVEYKERGTEGGREGWTDE